MQNRLTRFYRGKQISKQVPIWPRGSIWKRRYVKDWRVVFTLPVRCAFRFSVLLANALNFIHWRLCRTSGKAMAKRWHESRRRRLWGRRVAYSTCHIMTFLYHYCVYFVCVGIWWAKYIQLYSVAIDLRIDYPVPSLAQAETVDSVISKQTFESVSRRQFKK